MSGHVAGFWDRNFGRACITEHGGYFGYFDDSTALP